MTLEEAIDYFGNISNLCSAINEVHQTGTKMKRKGYISITYQLRIQEATGGKLIARVSDGKPRKKDKKHGQKRD